LKTITYLIIIATNVVGLYFSCKDLLRIEKFEWAWDDPSDVFILVSSLVEITWTVWCLVSLYSGEARGEGCCCACSNVEEEPPARP
jgi:hypothetical protein